VPECHCEGLSLQDKSRLQILKETPVFSGLSEREISELATLATEHMFHAGEFAFFEDDKPEWFFIIVSGRIKALKHSSSGKEFIIAFVGPGEMLGELAVFENKPYPASAQAVTETMLFRIKREDFIKFLTRHPEIALRIIIVLGERLRTAQGRLRDLAGERAEQRLARILIMLSSRLGNNLPFTRQEIADMSGLTIETAIRIMSRLREGGIIRSARGHIVILDEKKLKLLSEAPPIG